MNIKINSCKQTNNLYVSFVLLDLYVFNNKIEFVPKIITNKTQYSFLTATSETQTTKNFAFLHKTLNNSRVLYRLYFKSLTHQLLYQKFTFNKLKFCNAFN